MTAWSIDWFVADRSGNILGSLDGSGGSLTWDGNSRIQRVCRGVVFDRNQWADVNPFQDWFVPMFRDETGRRTRLGLFTAAAVPTVYTSQDLTENPQPYLVDPGLFLGQPSPYTLAGKTTERFSETLSRFAAAAGFTDVIVEPTGLYFGEPIGFSPGTAFADALEKVCELAGFLPPHFDRDGTLQIRSPRLFSDEPDVVYTSDQIVASSRLENNNLLEAANTVVVIGSGANRTEVVGLAEAPAFLPYSVQNRGGFRMTKVVKTQGVDSAAQAVSVAKNLVAFAAEGYETVEFTTLPNPAHDCFNLVSVNNVLYRQLEWTIDLAPGGLMTHAVSRGEVIE